MKASQLCTALVITTIVMSLFGVFTLDSIASAAITTPSVDTSIASKSMVWSATQSTPVTITTTSANEIIYASLYIKNIGRGLSISSTGSLTWHYRGGSNVSTSNGEIATWWAVCPTVKTITITLTASSSTGNGVASAFCIKNADTNQPFDSSSPVISSGSSTKTASTTITTVNPNEVVIGIIGTNSDKSITAGSGYTEISNTGVTSQNGASEYLQTSASGTYTPSFSVSNQANWVIIADSFVPVSQSVTITSSPTGAGFVTINGTAVTTTYTASYTPGTVLSISATGTKTDGSTRYVFSSWNDSGAQTHYYTVQSQDVTLVANYQTQYQITFAQSGLDSSVASTVLTGTLLTVNNTAIHYVNFSYSLWLNSGDKLIFAYNTTAASYTTGKQFILSSTSATSPLTVSGAQTITGTYLIQYIVNFTVSPPGSGTINRSDGYYTAGSSISLIGSPGSEYLFRNWTSSTGSITFTDNSAATTTMGVNGVGTVTAYYRLKPSTVLTMDTDIDTVDIGNPLTISGVLSYDEVGLAGKPIVISYFNGTTLINLATVSTNSTGAYQYVWNIPITMPNGMYIIRSDFAGDSQYAAASSADSSGTITVNVLPEYEYGGLLVIIIGLLTMSLYIRKQKRNSQPT
jgi:hypothetical protein